MIIMHDACQKLKFTLYMVVLYDFYLNFVHQPAKAMCTKAREASLC